MKKTFTTKLGLVALGLVTLSSQLKAVDVQTDFSNLLRNPGFEYVLDGSGNQVAPSKENNLSINGANDWFRFCPYGWNHRVVYNGNEIPWTATQNNGTATVTTEPAGAALLQSYGVNQDAQSKTIEGSYLMWVKSDKPLDLYELYQEIPVGNAEGQLPPGEYVVSCRLVVLGTNNTDRRFTTQRIFASTASQNKVQYYGRSTDYGANLTAGETATFADWISDNTSTNSSMYLKPMSVTITVSEGETLRIGVKTGNKDKDGNVLTGTDVGWFKVDAFHLTKKYTAPDDYTSSIINNNFELKGVLNAETQEVEVKPIAGATGYSERFCPYGWNHYVVKNYDESGNPVKLPWTSTQNNAVGTETEGGGAFGQSVGCNMGDNKITLIMEREYFSFWASMTSIPEYTLYQDVTGLPSGKYRVSCYMYVQTDRFRTQRLFANNHVKFFGNAGDYDLEKQLSGEEKKILTNGQLTVEYAGYAQGGEFQPMFVDVDVPAGETLRLGVRTSGVDKLGAMATDNAGIVRIDYFRLQRIGDVVSTGYNQTSAPLLTATGHQGGMYLNLNDAKVNVKIVALSGQLVYDNELNPGQTWVSLPQGLYMVKANINGHNQSLKVLVK